MVGVSNVNQAPADGQSNTQKPYHDPTESDDHDGLRRNSDPALNPAFQHTHGHKNHTARVAAENAGQDPVYTTGTTMDPSNVPNQAPLHQHDQVHLHAHTPGHNVHPAGTPPDYSDQEKGSQDKGVHGVVSHAQGHVAPTQPGWASGRFGFIYRHRRPLLHTFFFCLFTGWWIASLVLHRNTKNWVVPFLLWLAIVLRIATFYFSASKYVARPIKWVWKSTAVPVYNMIPAKLRTLAGAVVAIAAILVGTFVSEETADNTREHRVFGLLGLGLIIFVFWLTSRHRSHVNWRTVIGGMLGQYVIGLFVLRTGVGFDIFSWIADRAAELLGFAREGVAFLLDPDIAETPNFFFGVIPAIVFFVALCQLLFYYGIIQWFTMKLAVFVFWALNVSGAEAVVAAATPFIGQGESAMLVRPFVPHMTKAEIHQIMTCGFATIAGSVLVGYIGMGLNPEVLVSSCIMSIPASLAISKLRYPETEETLTAGKVVIPEDDESKAENGLHAFANGAWLGLKIAGSIITSLLCIIALVGLINGLLTWWGRYLNINSPELTLQTILGYFFYVVAFFLGVPRPGTEAPLTDPLPEGMDERPPDLLLVGRLIAEKVITNEYVAFNALANDPGYSTLSPRSQLIAIYACCGFGNIGSLGIQIGILGQLAPSRGGDVSRLAFSALITGVFATLTSAAVAGLVITNQINDITNSS